MKETYICHSFFVAAKHSKIFPGVASENDLQKWRTSRDRKSPSLSQMGPDSLKHKVSYLSFSETRELPVYLVPLFLSLDYFLN